MASIVITSKPPFRDTTTTTTTTALPREFKKPRSHSFSSSNTNNNHSSLNMIRSTAKESSRRLTVGSLPHPSSFDPVHHTTPKNSGATINGISNPKKHGAAARP
ncbi:hypothetical protein HDU81_002814, partial [Chytriomyces hyalinus]